MVGIPEKTEHTHLLRKLMKFRVSYQYFQGPNLVSLCFSFLEVNCTCIKPRGLMHLTTL